MLKKDAFGRRLTPKSGTFWEVFRLSVESMRSVLFCVVFVVLTFRDFGHILDPKVPKSEALGAHVGDILEVKENMKIVFPPAREFDSGGLSCRDGKCHEGIVVEFGDPEAVVTECFESCRLSSDPMQIHGS